MTKRPFCRALLVVVAMVGVLAFTSLLSAQGNSENAFEHVRAVQEKHTDILMARSGVVGTAVGLNSNGEYAVLVLLERPGVAGIPQEIEGVPVQVVVTGKILALATTDRFDSPVPIGVSTGHPDITAGTICCRVTDGTSFYALSNNHVYANQNKASLGDAVIQPGTYDGGSSPADDIGNLADFEPIVFSRKAKNKIDAAIALSSTSLLDKATPAGAGGYGTPNSIIVDAFIGQLVQKFGRTTGLTIGEVTGVNATVNIGYGPGQTAKFVKQIIIEPGGFSAGGDSGSLIVTNDANKNPVGLLFAGSSSVTIANRIDLVLSRFGVTIDGEVPSPPATGTIAGTVTSAGVAINGATISVDTGQSAITDVDGSYTITDVSTGNRSVTASAGGFVSQTLTADVSDGNETTVNFVLDPAATGSTVSVVSISYATEGGRNGDKHLTITLALEDDLGDPVSGASVSIDLFLNSSFAGSGSSTTGTGGTVTFILKNARSGDYTTTITDVSAAGLTWDGIIPPNNFTK